jgi:hypothetical protein
MGSSSTRCQTLTFTVLCFCQLAHVLASSSGKDLARVEIVLIVLAGVGTAWLLGAR